MTGLNSAALLSAWENGASQPPIQRALTLLTMAWPERSNDQWAQVSIGERDGRLLDLREELFGTKLEAIANCPQCGELLDITFNTQDIRVDVGAMPAPEARLQLQVDGYEVNFRLP